MGTVLAANDNIANTSEYELTSEVVTVRDKC